MLVNLFNYSQEQWMSMLINDNRRHFSLPSKVCHLHHNHTHLLREYNDVIATVIPLGDLSVQFGFLCPKLLYILLDLTLLLLGQIPHHGSITLLLIRYVILICDMTR